MSFQGFVQITKKTIMKRENKTKNFFNADTEKNKNKATWSIIKSEKKTESLLL